MEYKVLYRKYRPTDFANIVGQNYMVSILKNAIKNNKISHSYIFSGPRGTGKTTTAKVFAKAINCLNPNGFEPCNQCESCKHFKENSDIIEIDAASNNGVDEIREIINNIKLAPAYSKYKVYIIDEVHMLSTSAFNALLLTLEEPPSHVIFILATTNIEAVPITILSRCQRFDFHKISATDIISRLKYVINQENINIDEDALEEIAYLSDGGMRDALSILDQLSSTNSKITLEDVTANFGSISKKQINDLYKCIITNDVSTFISMMQKIKSMSIDYKLLIKKMLEQIEEEAIKIKKDYNYRPIEYNTLKDIAFELAKISNYVNVNVDPYLLIELTLLKYFENKNVDNLKNSGTNEKIFSTNQVDSNKIPVPSSKIISREIISQNPISKPKPLDPAIINIRINNCFVNAKKEFLNTIKNNWTYFKTELTDKQLLGMIFDTEVVAASDTHAILTNQVDATINLLNENIDAIASHYNTKYNTKYKFVAITPTSWQEERQKYIQNLKNKVQYKYQPEPSAEEKLPDKPINQTIEESALDLFDNDIVEIN